MYLACAPAKVILFGEHGVVHGEPCIATTFGKLTVGWATIPMEAEDEFGITCVDIELEYNQKIIKKYSLDQQVALDAFLRISGELGIKNVKMEIRSEIPVGAGLGSSASYSVVMASLLLLVANRISYPLSDDNLQTINEYAFKSEQVIHGTPSGVDNTLCTFGGAKIYQKGVALKNLEG
jgi:mevalonate kinase